MKKQSILVWLVVMTASTSGGFHINFHVEAPDQTLTILNPNGNERLLGGSTYTIRWQDSGSENCAGNYLLDYSIDDGNNWIPVDSNPVSNTCSYDWLVPSIFSNQCLIRITDANDPNISDESDDSFSIYRCMSDVSADWNGDCYVDFGDFSIIAAGWNVPGGTDINDLAVFVQYWLDCANPLDPSCSFGEAMPGFPADGVVIPGDIGYYQEDRYIFTELVFIPGPTAVEHTGYFCDDYSKVESRAEDANLGSPPFAHFQGWEYTFWVGSPQIPPADAGLIRGTTYYWTVDATDALDNTFAGDIWEFTILGFYAFEPSPPNEAAFVGTDVLLSWLPGYNVEDHEIYMGTSWEDVNNAVYNPFNPPPEFVASVEEPNILVTGLLDNTTYYWRVDEVQDRDSPIWMWIVYKGPVWCFTTISGSAEPNFPADGVVIPGEVVHYPDDDYISTSLIFVPGPTAVGHTGYFSDDYSKVESRTDDANLGPPPYGYLKDYEYTFWVGIPGVPPITDSLVRGQKYYWTVDETDALGNTFAGDIWEFSIYGYYAFEPSPPNEATFVGTDVLLSWQPGYGVDYHDIYMGTSWEDVNNVSYYTYPRPPEFVATVEEPNILVTGLLDNTRYYWRIDELHCNPFFYVDEIYKGDIWCFTIISGSAEPNFPADGTVIDGEVVQYPDDDYISTSLIFVPGPTAVEHTGYFSDDYSKVESRHPDANLGPPPYAEWEDYKYTFWIGNPYVPPANDTLVRGTKYYWTVDETDALGNTFAGDIWEFAIQGYYAFAPNPPNEATFVETDVLLSWLPGFSDNGHAVYLGTSWKDVNDAVYDPYLPPPELLGNISEPNILVTGLMHGVKYYWRVDECAARCPPPLNCCFSYKGDVWCFTTAPSALNNDGFINFKNYAIPSNYRQKTGPILPADFNKNDAVDYKD